MTVSVESNEATDDFLSHYGVKGMKWGRHSNKPSSADIKGARQRTKERVALANSYSVQAMNATTQKGREKAQKLLEKHAEEVLSHPDSVLAAKRTTGEKWAKAAVMTGTGLLGVAALTMNARR